MLTENYVLETPPSQLVKVATIAAQYRDRPDMLMEVLIQVQNVTSVISEEVTRVISREMHIPMAQVYSFVTFYAMLSVKPQGKYVIRMCKSAPCHIRGAQEIADAIKEQLGIDVGETTEDGRFSFEYCPCIGLCEESPAMLINERAYSNLTPETAKDIIKQYIREDVI